MNIDDELRRLFADDRWDIAVRPDAERVIVAGARRIRRRRRVAATAGAVAVAVVLGSGIALAGSGDRESLPPAVSTTTTPPTTPEAPVTTTMPPSTGKPPVSPPAAKTTGTRVPTTSTPPSYSLDVIDPWTYGPLRLSMSEQDALATGMLGAVRVQDTFCTRYTGTFGGTVTVSNKHGVVRVVVTRQVATSQGIHIGSTVADARAAYPGIADYRMGLYATTEPGVLAFWVAGPNEVGAPWPDTRVIDHIEIGASRSDCALAL